LWLPRRVNQAIDRGVAHLRRDWCHPKEYQNYLGLLGLTLLECGVPRTDPTVGRIADLVRSQRNLDATYELSQAILFLDRLGDPNDDGIIRTFAQRLLEGQSDSGCWGYTCGWRPASLPAGRNLPSLPNNFETQPGILGLWAAKRYATVATTLGGWQALHSDNCNTQFAVLGLWVAQRRGVSVGKALRLTAQHFRKSQGDDGSWTYTPNTPWHKLSMTCAGLFCLAAELSASPGYVRTSHPRATLRVDDPTITRGLRFLGKSFDAHAKGDAFDCFGGRLYFLWSLERLAAIYGLETIGSQEWYPWTAELLVSIQQGNGSWWEGPGPVPTCFALLILRRSNLTPDLLAGVPGVTQPRKPNGVSGPPLVQKPSSPRVPALSPELRTKPGADTPGKPPTSQVPTLRQPPGPRPPVYGPEQTLTLNIHIRNANVWPDIQARLKALLDSPKGKVKLNTISGAYYWVTVAPVNGEADGFARKVNFAKVVAVHMAQRLIYLDTERLAKPPVSRVPNSPNRLNRTGKKKD
jgi:hypothetical protein